MNTIVGLLAAGLLALGLTSLLRRYALARSLMDVPNERSSHVAPTPRGGGVAIVLTFLLGVLWLGLSGVLAWPATTGLLGAGALVALIGFLDDHGHIAAGWRLLGHFTAAAWALWWLGGLPPLPLFGQLLDLSWAGYVLAALYLVWLLNLYNFMDGIDGIAGVEAVTVTVSAAALAWLVGASLSLVVVPLLLAVAVAGFLFWNFPPARIFMGDAGSGFLGLTLGVLSLQAAQEQPVLIWSWGILLGVFIVDATMTLIRRLLRGHKPYEAHRSHAYQYASRCFGAHRPVTLAVLGVNVCWLFPWALAVALGWVDGALAVALAYVPLLGLAHRFRAGAPEQQEA